MSERYDPAIHDARFKFSADTGKEYCRNILTPLVVKGQSVSVDEPVEEKGYTPVSMRTASVDLEIYRTDKPVQKLEKGKRRTFIVPNDAADGAADGPNVPERAKAASVTVNTTDDLNTPLDKRIIDVALFFGRTEIVVNGTAALTGESRYATIRYE